MNVIVTGAKGFIGRSMMEYMLQKDHTVTGWDVGREDELPDGIRVIDMRSLEEVEKALASLRPDVIIHCAGSANVSESVANPDRDFELNVGITHNLLYAMLRQGLNKTRLVYLSSAAVYGNPRKLPVFETDEVHPISPYALHKSMCEDMCRYFAENHGFDIRIARIFSAYGDGLRKQIFWDMYRKITDTGRLEMFGDGTESRDFIYIDDLVRALYLIVTDDNDTYDDGDGVLYRVVNVANGEEIPISRVVGIFAGCMGIPDGSISFNGIRRDGDPHNWQADIYALRALGYTQSISIEDGISQYCDWVKSNE